MTPQDRYISVNGIRARYWQMGASGTPLVLIHGVGHTAQSFEQNIAALAARSVVYAPDLIGHGFTDKPNSPYHVDDLAYFVRNFMAAVGVRRAHILGHSLGGGVAMRFAALFPQMVERLVLEAPAGFCTQVYRGFRLATIPLLGEFLTRPTEGYIRSLTRALLFDKNLVTPDRIAWQLEAARQPGQQQAVLKILRMHSTYFGLKRWVTEMFNQEAPKIGVGTLILWGEDDEVLPYKQSKRSLDKIAGAKLHLFHYCGHIPHWEYPDDFNRIVSAFVNAA